MQLLIMLGLLIYVGIPLAAIGLALIASACFWLYVVFLVAVHYMVRFLGWPLRAFARFA